MNEKKFLDEQGLGVIKEYIDIHSPLQSGDGINSIENKNAETIGDNSIALGNDSITGYRGYHIRSIDITNKKIYLSAVYPTTETIPTISEEDFTDTEFETPAYNTNVEFSIILGQHYHFFGGKIVSVQNNVIIYSGDLPFDTIPSVALTKPWRYLFFVPSQPQVGALIFGSGGFSEGTETYAEGNQSHAEGYGTIAAGNQSHAEGVDTKAGVQAHAEGESSIANGETSHAEGRNTLAEGKFSHAENYLTKATNEATHAEGHKTVASGRRSHAEGDGSVASGIASHAEGGSTKAQGSYAHTEGYATQVDEKIQYGAHAEGHGSKVSAEAGHAEGNYGVVTGDYGHAEGDHSTSSGIASHAEGCYGEASGDYSHTEGYKSIASNMGAHAEGGYVETIENEDGTITKNEYKNTASGISSHSEGANTQARGIGAHSEGTNTVASGNSSHAEGNKSKAQGAASHAEGLSSVASGGYAHAEGVSTASGHYSHSENYSTTASGEAAHAEGYKTTASKQAAHAEGRQTTASGAYSHTEGYQTQATNTSGHAEGTGTIARGNSQHVEGKYNLDNEYAGHIMGNGTSDTKRSNAAEVSWDGIGWFANGVKVGGTGFKDATAKKLASEEYVDTKVASIVESAPETLNTLNELAAALGDDPNFATTVSERIGLIENEIEDVNNSLIKLDDIVEGKEIVPLALQAHEDILGRDIVETYLEKVTTIVKELNSSDFDYYTIVINEFLPVGTVLTFSDIDTSSIPEGYNWGFGFFENETQFDWIPFSEIVTYTMPKSVSNLTIRVMETDYGAIWEESSYLVKYSIISSLDADIKDINSTISNIVSGELPVAFAEQAYYSTTADYATNAGVADFANEAGFASSAISSYSAEVAYQDALGRDINIADLESKSVMIREQYTDMDNVFPTFEEIYNSNYSSMVSGLYRLDSKDLQVADPHQSWYIFRLRNDNNIVDFCISEDGYKYAINGEWQKDEANLDGIQSSLIEEECQVTTEGGMLVPIENLVPNSKIYITTQNETTPHYGYVVFQYCIDGMCYDTSEEIYVPTSEPYVFNVPDDVQNWSNCAIVLANAEPGDVVQITYTKFLPIEEVVKSHSQQLRNVATKDDILAAIGEALEGEY